MNAVSLLGSQPPEHRPDPEGLAQEIPASGPPPDPAGPDHRHQVALGAEAYDHPRLKQAIACALGSKYPGDVLLCSADALAELEADLAAPAAGRPQLPPAFRLRLLADHLRLAADRHGRAPVPVLPVAPPPPAVAKRGVNLRRLLVAVQVARPRLDASCGSTTAQELERCCRDLINRHGYSHQTSAADIAQALADRGLRTMLPELVAAIDASPRTGSPPFPTHYYTDVIQLLWAAERCAL